MKKLLLKLCLVMMLIIPCTVVFSACGDKKKEDSNPPTNQTQQPTPEPEDGEDDENSEPEVVVTLESVDVELDGDHSFDYDAETNTISFVYGSTIEFLKEDFILTANYDDESSTVVTNYTIDASEVAETPDVGEYEVKFTYEDKTATVNVKIDPKPIQKPVNDWGSSVGYTYNENGGVAEEYSVSVEDFDEDTMECLEGSTFAASQVGKYYIDIVPKSNYIWEENVEFGEEANSEPVRFEWNIDKRVIYMSSPEILVFAYEEGVEREIVFIDFSEYYPFEANFEVVSGTTKATDVGTYTFTVALKEEKAANYYISDIEYIAGVDFVYSTDGSTITYTWVIE